MGHTSVVAGAVVVIFTSLGEEILFVDGAGIWQAHSIEQLSGVLGRVGWIDTEQAAGVNWGTVSVHCLGFESKSR